MRESWTEMNEIAVDEIAETSDWKNGPCPLCKQKLDRTNTHERKLPFGIARNAIRTKPAPCARRMLLWMLPTEPYSGQNSLSPVPTETVVLSLPSITGTNIAPSFAGDSAIMSWNKRDASESLEVNHEE